MADATSARGGRSRASIDGAVLAAARRTVHEHGYAGATMDRIAAAAGVAKTTLYRRWPSKGTLIADSIVDAFGPLPDAEADIGGGFVATAIGWGAARLAEPGVAAAFAGVFAEAISDPDLRRVLSARLQEPYVEAVRDRAGLSRQRVLLLIDVVVGTLLHRMGMTGAVMTEADLADLAAMLHRHLDL